MSYLSIENLYKNQDILLFKEAYALEKIHGSSAHLGWNNSQLIFFSGGEKHEKFMDLFDAEFLLKTFQDNFGQDKATIYGEVYGGKMQAMSHTYGKDSKFIVFDIKVGYSWLSVPVAEAVAKKFNLEFVHYRRIPTDLAMIDAERDADSVQAIRNGVGPGKKREGIVLRPIIELTKNDGKRIICKHKREDFQERKTQPPVSADKLIVLENAQKIAEEWVVPMRLVHILQKLAIPLNLECIPIVVKAMVEDVYREAEGEIVESKEVKNAIGKETVRLFRKKCIQI